MAVGYDFILATSPVILLWSAKISRYDKALLCGLLALGGLVELVLSIIVGCLPTLRPLFNKKKIDQRLPYRRQKVIHAMTDWGENRIKKTVSIDVCNSEVEPEKSPCEAQSVEEV
ncbi:MAG: hypothetical protein L6R41_004285 [Letrouitia leprolyta]|nr:MAG: hypothetical protein L6R41_004285 [Letrouitia leprolyta]